MSATRETAPINPDPSSRDRSDGRVQSFAETAMRLGGKSEEEARRMGAVDKADEQVESLFAPQYQTVNSPVHQAVWDGATPVQLFMPPPLPATAPGDTAMERCLDVVRQRREAGTLYGEDGKLKPAVLDELGEAGFWGLLIDPKYGGHGVPFARFTRFITKMAMVDAMVAGLASVHGCIGAVDPVRSFGSVEQKQRLLPKLASGESISGFALTEPCAGSDLTALRTTATLVGDHYEVNGEKLFITNAIAGRTIGLVVMLDGKPAVLIAELPAAENEHFQTVPYGLYALRHGHNNGLRFNRFAVPKANLLVPPMGDGLTIAYHGLNLGRLTLCASAAGTMRVLLANMLPWAAFRRTYGQAINTRELVKRRIARMAALIAGADALTAWGSWLIDQGYRGELECVIAKIFGSEALKESAIELFMKTHGGRSFLRGHLFGDNIYDYLAPCIYEGEGEMLGLAFFKSLAKHHGQKFFEPIGKALQKHKIRAFRPMNPLHLWKLRSELSAYTKWSMGQRLRGRDRQQVPGLDKRLTEHLNFALEQFQRFPLELSGAMSKHQLKLADRQCRMAELSQRVQDTVVILVTTLWAHQQASAVAVGAADMLCQDMRRKLTGQRASDHYFRDAGQLADLIIGGGYEELAGVRREEILMRYEQPKTN
ncbi:MAG TPA: acyl-CoA dehydrogenase family protein [Gemmataceae bacterium]|nr:acyl-CoA dehydrogenase family protein [Gemmataceae bacterium]